MFNVCSWGFRGQCDSDDAGRRCVGHVIPPEGHGVGKNFLLVKGRISYQQVRKKGNSERKRRNGQQRVTCDAVLLIYY